MPDTSAPWVDLPVEGGGAGLMHASWWGTGVMCVAVTLNAITGDRDSYLLSAIPALVLFTGGCVAFLWAFAIAVGRSRQEAVGVVALYFLAGCAPRRVQVSMMSSLGVVSIVPLLVALMRPFTAFGVLAPMWALGLAGLWGARYGHFPPRAHVVVDDAPGPASAPPSGRPDCGPDDPRTEARADG